MLFDNTQIFLQVFFRNDWSKSYWFSTERQELEIRRICRIAHCLWMGSWSLPSFFLYLFSPKARQMQSCFQSRHYTHCKSFARTKKSSRCERNLPKNHTFRSHLAYFCPKSPRLTHCNLGLYVKFIYSVLNLGTDIAISVLKKETLSVFIQIFSWKNAKK